MFQHIMSSLVYPSSSGSSQYEAKRKLTKEGKGKQRATESYNNRSESTAYYSTWILCNLHLFTFWSSKFNDVDHFELNKPLMQLFAE